MKRGHNFRSFLLGVLCTILAISLAAPALAAAGRMIEIFGGIKVYVDDVQLNPTDVNGKPVDVFLHDGTTYLPARAISEALGKQVQWDEATRSVYIGRHGTTPAAGSYRVAMITDSGDITDQSFNQAAYEACREYCGANGVDFQYFKPAGFSDADFEAAINAVIADGYNIIVVPGYMFGPALQQTVPANPDAKFIALDVSAADLGDMGEYMPDNLYCVDYREELAGYMAGYAAVKLGYTRLGFLGGMPVPSVQRYGYGFVQGADAAARELGNTAGVSVNYIYAGQFFGSAPITAQMDDWYSKGTEVVFACGGSIYTSAAEAAARVDGKIIGVDVDQAGAIDAYGEGMTVTSAMKGLAPTVRSVLAEIIEKDNWAACGGRVAALGLASGGSPEDNYVQLPMDSTQWSDRFTQADYRTLVERMRSGELTVSSDISVEPSTEIKVDYQGTVNGWYTP